MGGKNNCKVKLLVKIIARSNCPSGSGFMGAFFGVFTKLSHLGDPKVLLKFRVPTIYMLLKVQN